MYFLFYFIHQKRFYENQKFNFLDKIYDMKKIFKNKIFSYKKILKFTVDHFFIGVIYFKEFENLSVQKKTLSTALGCLLIKNDLVESEIFQIL